MRSLHHGRCSSLASSGVYRAPGDQPEVQGKQGLVGGGQVTLWGFRLQASSQKSLLKPNQALNPKCFLTNLVATHKTLYRLENGE